MRSWSSMKGTNVRIRATLSALLVVATTGASLVAASGIARAQTPTPTTVPLAACPTGTLTVAAPTTAAPSTVTATIVPALTNLKAASAADAASVHLHYFVDTPATAAGSVVPVGDPKIIHSGTLTQDVGTLAAGSHTVVVVVGQLDHRACDLRGQVTFTAQAAATATPTAATTPAATATVAPVTPPSTGSGGLLGQASEATSSPLALAALALATVLAVGGAAVATRRR
jgi:hypothetical protein